MASGKDKYVWFYGEMKNSLLRVLKHVTKVFTAAKNKNPNATRDELRGKKESTEDIKAVIYDVMPQAHAFTSGPRKLPANSRQLFYAARNIILKAGRLKELDGKYFKSVLTKYLIENRALHDNL